MSDHDHHQQHEDEEERPPPARVVPRQHSSRELQMRHRQRFESLGEQERLLYERRLLLHPLKTGGGDDDGDDDALESSSRLMHMWPHSLTQELAKNSGHNATSNRRSSSQQQQLHKQVLVPKVDTCTETMGVVLRKIEQDKQELERDKQEHEQKIAERNAKKEAYRKRLDQLHRPRDEAGQDNDDVSRQSRTSHWSLDDLGRSSSSHSTSKSRPSSRRSYGGGRLGDLLDNMGLPGKQHADEEKRLADMMHGRHDRNAFHGSFSIGGVTSSGRRHEDEHEDTNSRASSKSKMHRWSDHRPTSVSTSNKNRDDEDVLTFGKPLETARHDDGNGGAIVLEGSSGTEQRWTILNQANATGIGGPSSQMDVFGNLDHLFDRTELSDSEEDDNDYDKDDDSLDSEERRRIRKEKHREHKRRKKERRRLKKERKRAKREEKKRRREERRLRKELELQAAKEEQEDEEEIDDEVSVSDSDNSDSDSDMSESERNELEQNEEKEKRYLVEEDGKRPQKLQEKLLREKVRAAPHDENATRKSSSSGGSGATGRSGGSGHSGGSRGRNRKKPQGTGTIGNGHDRDNRSVSRSRSVGRSRKRSDTSVGNRSRSVSRSRQAHGGTSVSSRSSRRSRSRSVSTSRRQEDRSRSRSRADPDRNSISKTLGKPSHDWSKQRNLHETKLQSLAFQTPDYLWDKPTGLSRHLEQGGSLLTLVDADDNGIVSGGVSLGKIRISSDTLDLSSMDKAPLEVQQRRWSVATDAATFGVPSGEDEQPNRAQASFEDQLASSSHHRSSHRPQNGKHELGSTKSTTRHRRSSSKLSSASSCQQSIAQPLRNTAANACA